MSARRSSVPSSLWLVAALVASCAVDPAAPADAAVTLDATTTDTAPLADVAADVADDVDPAVTRGTAVFRRSCARCHGARGAGTGDGPDLRRAVPASTDDAIRRIIREGGRVMPVVPLDDAQREDVFTYLRAAFGAYQEP